MKHSRFLLLAAAGMAVCATSCSSEQDDPTPVSSDNVIRFTAATPQAQERAADITTGNLNQFFVYGYLTSDKSPYMSDVEVNKTSSNQWEYSPVKYWPTGNALDFYAYAPAGVIPPGLTPLDKIPFTNTGMTDFIYALATDKKQPAPGTNAQVSLNFRHALAKVTVMLSSEETKLDVKVNNVTIVGANQSGEFTYPTVATTGDPETASANSIGTWSNLSGKGITVLHMAQRQNEILTLTAEPVNADTEGDAPSFFIPQDLPYVDGGDFANEVYLVLTCAMYDKETGAKVWPNENTPAINLPNGGITGEGYIYLSLQGSSFTAWKSGYHYVYNVVINGHPDMSQIEFGDPTVDSYVTVTTQLQP